MTDKIIVKNLGLLCKLGITFSEQEEKQPVFVDIELTTDLKPAGISDDISKTINYSSVCNEIKKIAEKEHKTIEAIAENIAKQIKTIFKPLTVKVLIKKPGALARKGAKYAAVEIER